MTASLVDQKNQPYQNKHRDIKEHEKAMLRLIEAVAPQGSIDVLDVGCADGMFLEAVSRRFVCRTLHGLDNDPELVAVARERPYRADRARIFFEDAGVLTREEAVSDLERYDVIVASGILAFFEEQEQMIGAMCRYLKSGGALFVFNKIITADVDMRYAIRPSGAASWGEGRLVPSLRTLTTAMETHLRDVTVQRFEMPFDLPGSSNVHSTSTIQTIGGSRMLLTKYNLVSELAFLYGWR